MLMLKTNASARLHGSGPANSAGWVRCRARHPRKTAGLRGLIASTAMVAMLLLAPSASAQRISFGAVVGGYANRDFVDHYNIPMLPFPPDTVRSDSGGYVIGPSIEVHFTRRFSLGLDALYKPLHYEQSATFTQTGEVIGFAPATVVTWQFPVLARYRFPLGRIRPFIEGGPSLRATGNLNLSNPSHFGVSAGAGIEAQWGRLSLAPGVRYTRWAKDIWWANVRSRPDQVEVLVRLSWTLWAK